MVNITLYFCSFGMNPTYLLRLDHLRLFMFPFKVFVSSQFKSFPRILPKIDRFYFNILHNIDSHNSTLLEKMIQL